MPLSLRRSPLVVDWLTLLVRDPGMKIERLCTLPGVEPFMGMNDENESCPKNSGFLCMDRESGNLVEIYEVPYGTLFYGKTEDEVVRVASVLRGKPLEEAAVTNMCMVCRFWSPPDLESLARLIDEWHEWRPVGEQESDSLQDMEVQCCAFLDAKLPRVCMRLRRIGSDSVSTVVLWKCGRCDVTGLRREDRAEEIIELACELFHRMERA